MTTEYQLAVYIPLLVLLIALLLVEIRTTRIPDKVLFPAAIYFLIVTAATGPEPWWHYPASLLALVGLFLLVATASKSIWGFETIGGGAIKLMGVVGAALGFAYSIKFVFIFSIVIVAALVVARFKNIRIVHSSMCALIAVILVWSFR